MLVLLRQPSRRFRVRHFHNSTRVCNLVGPIDPVSHMRPVIYDDVPTDDLPSGHPYSLTEFSIESFKTAGQNGLQLKLQQQQLDALNQNFWLDSNTRFETAKAAVLSSLPPSSSALDKETALSEFYKQWVSQEKPATDQYTAEWRKRNIGLIILAARVEYQKFKSRFTRTIS